jgi:hypothetical protein
MHQLILAASSGATFADLADMPLGSFWFGVFVAACINIVIWFVLPFIVLAKLNEMIRRLKSIETATEASAENTRPPGTKRPESAARY